VLQDRHAEIRAWPAPSTVVDLLARRGLVHKRRRRRPAVHPGVVRPTMAASKLSNGVVTSISITSTSPSPARAKSSASTSGRQEGNRTPSFSGAAPGSISTATSQKYRMSCIPSA